MYEIVETKPTTSAYTWFERVPGLIHKYYKREIFEKNQLNHTFLDTCFVLIADGKPVGRIATYLNPNLTYDGKLAGALGNYECIHDTGCAHALLQAGYDRLADKGVSYVIGPCNGSTWDTYRFRTLDQADSFFLESANPTYYNEQFQSFGFDVIGRYYSAIDRQLSQPASKVAEVRQRLEEKGIRFRKVHIEQFEADLAKLHSLAQESFQDNFLFTPIHQADFIQKYAPFKHTINPDFVQFAEDADGQMVGVIFAIEDFTATSDPRLIIKTLARKPGAAYKGVGQVLTEIVYSQARGMGIDAVIHAYMIEQAVSTRLSDTYTGEAFQHYLLYGMPTGVPRKTTSPTYTLSAP